MELLKNNIVDSLLKNKIELEMSVSDFLSMYIAKMTCSPEEFKEYQDEIFTNLNEKNLFINSISTEEMEAIIDEIGFPHRDWYLV